MKFFIDTANLDEIKEAQDLWRLRWCHNQPIINGEGGNYW